MTDFQRVAVTFVIVALLALAIVGIALAKPLESGQSPAPQPASTGQGPEALVPHVTLDSLLASAGSEVERSSTAPEPSPAGDEPHLLTLTPGPGSVATEATVEGDAGDTTPGGSDAPSTARDYAAIAACGPSCWGERMTRAEVEALALRVTGDAAWSAWAGRCFSRPGAESGGYPQAVGGPNYHHDGGISWDLGIGQSNTRTLAGLGYAASRVLEDVEYAMRALYATWQAQGYGAWFGCAS